MLFHFAGEVNNFVWALLGLNLTQGKILDFLFRDRSLRAGGGLCGLYTDEMVSLEHKVSYHNNHLLRKNIGIVNK